jgi:hypothetical protein
MMKINLRKVEVAHLICAIDLDLTENKDVMFIMICLRLVEAFDKTQIRVKECAEKYVVCVFGRTNFRTPAYP